MAGRNTKPNFDFFRLDTDFFSNKKIKTLRRHFGSVGILTYLYILSYAYGNDGYYIRIDSIEEFAYDIAESIGNSNLTQIASVATDCINYLASRGEINKHLLDKGVISGESIQRQYIEMCLSTKRKVEIKDEYRLVDIQEYPITKMPISSEEMPISSEEMPISSEEMQQRKVKESKYNIIPPNSACARACEDVEVEGLKDFCERFNIAVDGYDGAIGEMDFIKLSECYEKSKTFLQVKPFAKNFKWICRNYKTIITGQYDDFEKKPKAQKQTAGGDSKLDIAKRAYERYLAEEQENGEQSGNSQDDNGD